LPFKIKSMHKISFFVGLIFCILSTVNIIQAQNPSSIEVNKLSDQQIQQIVSEVSSRGLSIDEAAKMAQLQGATPLQIEQLKRRIQELNFSKGKSIGNPNVQNTQTNTTSRESFSEKSTAQASPKAKRIFGFQLFNSENLTFEPPVNIPTPQNYVLGIDDELSISIWGASQQNYQLQIETNGAVNIPDIGPVYISGMEFSKAKELIKKRLIAIYQGMNEPSPNTFAEVSISNLRSIKVNVIGEVIAPGTYTLPSTASAFNALYLSGGPNENGSFRNIQVIRDNKTIKTIDVYDYLINANTLGNIQLREQDIIYIPTYQKRVEAIGAFKRTGIFELTEKENLKDLIRYLGGFTDQAFQAQLSLTRITDKEKKVIDISQSIYESFTPLNGDAIVAAEIIDRYENRINISGAVFRPGTYELTEGLMLSGLIKKAQGVRENYFSNRGQIIRLQSNMAPITLSFNVDEVLKGKNDITLQREDQVIIQDIFSMRQKRTIQIFGEVQKPGEFEFSDNMTLKDLIFKANGFTEAASESYIELARRHNYEEANKMGDEIVKLFQFSIDRKLNLDSPGDTFHLQPFDYIYVRKAPSYLQQRTVFISGEVRYPGAYSIGSKSERISDLIMRAGGILPNAFIKGARMKRANQQAAQNIEALRNSSADSLLVKAEKQINFDQLELRLDDILKNPGTPFDYYLKNGDQISIPEVSQEVRISGEIQNPIGLAFQQGKGLKYYVNHSGGYSDKALKRKVFVIYSDGTTQVTKSLIFHNYPHTESGCQIIVPQKPEKSKIDNTGKWLAYTSTLATIVIAISTILK
jgi:protein involved in polysaccharide export with SLBB domain